jgi:hypothetical protein
MRKAATLHQQSLLLREIGSDLIHLGDQSLELGPLTPGALTPLARLFHLARKHPEAPAHLRHLLGTGADRRARKGIEDRQLGDGPHEASLLVLAREAHERTDKRGNAVARRHLAIHEGAGAPLRLQMAVAYGSGAAALPGSALPTPAQINLDDVAVTSAWTRPEGEL